MAKGEPIAASEVRLQQVETWLLRGATRGHIVCRAKEQWGICQRSADSLVAMARKRIHDNWANIERPQMIAELLSQLSDLQLSARESGNLPVALGAINTAAKICQLM